MQTAVLRALGYKSGSNFQWDRAWELSDQIGLTDGRYHRGTTDFVRGDIAVILYVGVAWYDNWQNHSPAENWGARAVPDIPG